MERVRREPATWKIQRFSKSNRIALTGLLQRCTTKLASWACEGGKRGHAHLASRDACSRLAHTARPSRSRCSAKDCTTELSRNQVGSQGPQRSCYRAAAALNDKLAFRACTGEKKGLLYLELASRLAHRRTLPPVLEVLQSSAKDCTTVQKRFGTVVYSEDARGSSHTGGETANGPNKTIVSFPTRMQREGASFRLITIL